MPAIRLEGVQQVWGSLLLYLRLRGRGFCGVQSSPEVPGVGGLKMPDESDEGGGSFRTHVVDQWMWQTLIKYYGGGSSICNTYTHKRDLQ